VFPKLCLPTVAGRRRRCRSRLGPEMGLRGRIKWSRSCNAGPVRYRTTMQCAFRLAREALALSMARRAARKMTIHFLRDSHRMGPVCSAEVGHARARAAFVSSKNAASWALHLVPTSRSLGPTSAQNSSLGAAKTTSRSSRRYGFFHHAW
jgi:hypothetical protein